MNTDNNPYIVTDYHLLREEFRDCSSSHTEDLIRYHNQTITKNDNVLFLGDLSEEEVYLNPSLMKKLRKAVLSLNHKNFAIVLGNNDNKAFKDFYYSCGFDKIYILPVLVKNPTFKPFGPGSQILYSHKPIDIEKKYGMALSKKILNIHGHIHGSKQYWSNINPVNHLDAWYELYPKSMRLSELIEFFKNGEYNNLKQVNKPMD